MDVSIIIVNYNTRNLTLQCLNSLYKTTNDINFEVIIIDNASSDDSVVQIEKYFPQVILIKSKKNLGFGKANNLGAKLCNGKYLFLLNSDTILINNTILHFFNYMENNIDKSIACCGASLIDKNKKPTISAGNFPSLIQEFSDLGFYKFYRNYYINKLSPGYIIPIDENKIKEVDYISGADIFIHKNVFMRLSGFDSDYFMYFEETDLFLRLKKLNLKSVILTSEKIIHLEGGSLINSNKININKIKLIYKSKSLYYRKNKGLLQTYIMKYINIFYYLLRPHLYLNVLKNIISIIIYS